LKICKITTTYNYLLLITTYELTTQELRESETMSLVVISVSRRLMKLALLFSDSETDD